MRRVIIGVFTAVVLAILFVVLCTYVRRPYEEVLLNRFGTLIGQDRQARIAYNWYFKLPTDSVVRIDTRLHLYTGPLQQMATANKEPISIRTFAAWHIVDPVKFYQTTGGGSDQRAKEIMEQKLLGLVQGKLASHTLDELFNTDEAKVHTGKIEDEVAIEATGSREKLATGARADGLLDQGLEIVEVGFSRMAFPPVNAAAVYSRMVSDLNVRAALYDSQAQQAVAVSRSAAENKANEIRAKALADAEIIRGEGDREALEIIAQVQNTEAAEQFYRYWKSLDFVKSSLAKNTILVLSSDSDWLKAVFRAPDSGPFVAPTPSTRPASSVGSTTPLEIPGLLGK